MEGGFTTAVTEFLLVPHALGGGGGEGGVTNIFAFSRHPNEDEHTTTKTGRK